MALFDIIQRLSKQKSKYISSLEIVTIGSKGGDISYNLITYLGNFSREKLKLLTLKLNVTMKHLTIILLGWWTFQMFLGVNNFVNFSQKIQWT